MVFLAEHLVFSWLLLLGLMALGALLRGRIGPLEPLRGYAADFVSLGLGLLALVLLTAVYWTRGRTLLALALLPLAAGFWPTQAGSGPAAPGPAPQPRRVRWLATAAAATLLYAAQALPLRAAPGSPLGMRIPHPDTVYFGFLAESLTGTGVESIYPHESAYAAGHVGLTPYHFFEIWLAAGLARLTGVPAVVTYNLWVLPVLAVEVVLGMWAVAELLGTSTAAARLLLGALFFLPAGPAGLADRVVPGSSQFLLPLLPLTGKVLTLAALLLTAAVLALARLERGALAVLAAMLPLSVVGGPAGAVLAASVCAWCWRSNRAISRSGLLALGLTLASLAAFYAAWGDRTLAYASPSSIAGTNLQALALRTKLDIVGKSCLQAASAYACHALVLAALLLRSAARPVVAKLWVAAGVLVLGGALGSALASAQLNGHAFVTQVATPAVLVLTVAAFGAWHRDVRLKRALSLGLGALGLVFAFRSLERSWLDEAPAARRAYEDRYDLGYLREVTSLRLPSPLGGFLVAADEIGDPWDQARPLPTLTPTIYGLGGYLAFVPGVAPPTMLGTFGLAHTNTKLRELAPFYRYARRPGFAGDAERALPSYLDETRLGYVIASAGAQVPAAIQDRAVRSIRDPGTGQSFIVLREPSPRPARP